MTTSIQVQSVLYHNSLSEIWRFARGITATIRHTRRSRGTAFVVRLGDCSSTPALSELDVAELESAFREVDASFSYEFFDANLGSALGHNRLADASGDADFLLVINPDTCSSPSVLVELLAAMPNQGTAIAEARQIPVEHPKHFDPATGETSWASTCCVLIWTSIFRELNGFDHHFFPLYCDDVDFSWRARLAGHRVVHVPRAVVFHDKSIAPDGNVVTSDFESYSGALAQMMLCVRYGNPSLLDQVTRWIALHGHEPLRRALAEFEHRRDANDLPAHLEGSKRVAQFVDGAYAKHRF